MVDPRRIKQQSTSIFINNKLNIQVRNYITFNLKNIDLIAIEISKDELNTKRNVIILIIYRPPDVLPNLFNDKLNDLLQMLNQENKTMFLTGDVNINTSDAIINPRIILLSTTKQIHNLK